jgi:hypothetical protein
MQVQASDSFFKSLKTLIWHQSPIYRTYSLFRYRLPGFIKNVWRFRRELWSHRWWDYRFTLEMLYRSLSIMVVKLEKDGIEEDVSRGKKVVKIKRTLELLKHKLDDDYIERTEDEYGKLVMKEWKFEKSENDSYLLVDEDTEEEMKHNRMIFKKAHDLEHKEWIELWEIIKGKKYKHYKDWDGSDLRGWWD